MIRAIPIVICVALLEACAKRAAPPPAATNGGAPVVSASRAKVTVQPLGKDGKVRGHLFVNAIGAGIKVQGTLRGFAKRSTHGVSIADARACETLGPHFNPKRDSHGGPADSSSHLGDLGNLSSGSDGEALISVLRPGARLDTGPSGIIGRALVIYEALDDFKTQPDGDAGQPIACGIVTPDG